MRYLLPCLLLVTFFGCQDDDDVMEPDPDRQEVATIVVTDEVAFPEGIAYDASDNTVFTGSIVNGAIYFGDKNSDSLQLRTVTGQTPVAALGMQVSGDELYVAGGPSTFAYIIDLNTDESRQLTTPPVPTGDSSFVNDLVVGSDGTAYFTNSFSPVLYRHTGGDSLEAWIELDSTVIAYGPSFNLNGIAISPDDRYLLTVQSNTGLLFRVDTDTREITAVDLGGQSLTGGDGIELDGNELFVVRNMAAEVLTIEMSDDYASGQLRRTFTSEAFQFPTTVAATSDSLLVINAQLNAMGPGGSPVLPFTISKFAR